MEIETVRVSQRALYIHFFLMLLVSMVLASGILFTIPARAAIRPSFMPADCVWHSTDIVVATAGDTIDGTFTVLDVWKGNLSVGTTISIPPLAAFAPLETRSISYLYFRQQPGDPMYVTGKKIVLFLRKPGTGETGWQPACLWKEWPTSVVWIETDKLYAFRQLKNPGPSTLMELQGTHSSITPDSLKSQVDAFDNTQDRLNAAIGIKDARTRTEALTHFLDSDDFYVRGYALDAISSAGGAALPELRKMLRDPALQLQYGYIIRTMGKAGGPDSNPDMLALVKSELRYWRKVGPTLPVGWWNDNGRAYSELEVMRDHEGDVYYALCALADNKYHGNLKVISDLRDFWDSLPQLNDKSGLNQVGDECDLILKQTGR